MTSTSLAPIALPETKRALVIGNNAYIKSPKLQCCVNDAEDIRDKLCGLNFKVKFGIDLNYAEMEKIIHDFVGEIGKGDLVVFFFAGHGAHSKDQDYLMPVNDQNITSTTIHFHATNAKAALQDIMNRRPLAAILLLDCCRTTFYDGTRRADDSQANLALNPVAGSLVAYACAEKESARDDGKNGRNGVFTSHLLQHIATPNLRIEEMMCYVCKGVTQDVPNGQTPVRHSALSNPHIYFNYRTEPGKFIYLGSCKENESHHLLGDCTSMAPSLIAENSISISDDILSSDSETLRKFSSTYSCSTTHDFQSISAL